MGNKILGTDIAGILRTSLRGMLLDATLTKISAGSVDPNNIGAGPAITETDYTAEGFVESYDENRIDGTIVQESDRLVILIGESIQSFVVPEPQDKITIESVTYTIVQVTRDPDAAIYECQVR